VEEGIVTIVLRSDRDKPIKPCMCSSPSNNLLPSALLPSHTHPTQLLRQSGLAHSYFDLFSSNSH
jgi:hypothetical protein